MKNPLTKREEEITKLVLEEYTSRQLATVLNVSIRTIDTHRKNILKKTNTKTVIGLLKFAIRAELIEDYYYKSGSSKRNKVHA